MKNKVKLLAASLVILASSSFAQSTRTNDPKITGPVLKGERGIIVGTTPVTKGERGDIVATTPVTKGERGDVVVTTPVTKGERADIVATTPVTKGERADIIATTPVTKGERGDIVATTPVTKGERGDIVATVPVTKGKEAVTIISDPVLSSSGSNQFTGFNQFKHNHPMLTKLLMQNKNQMTQHGINPKAFVKRQVIVRNHMQLTRGRK